MKRIGKFNKFMSMIVAFVMLLGIVQVSLPVSATEMGVQTISDLILYPSPRNITAQSGKYSLVNGNITSDDVSLKAVEKNITDVS